MKPSPPVIIKASLQPQTSAPALDPTNKTHVAHGFRASARTLLAERLGERIDLIEMQLAHAVRDANGRAYNRTQFLIERAAMMQRWADYCDNLRQGGRVVSLPRKAA